MKDAEPLCPDILRADLEQAADQKHDMVPCSKGLTGATGSWLKECSFLSGNWVLIDHSSMYESAPACMNQPCCNAGGCAR